MTRTSGLLAHVRFRWRFASFLEDLQTGLAVGGVAALAVLLARRVALPDLDPWLAAQAAAVGLFGVVLVGFLRRGATDRELAAVADDRLGLRERISTSLWCRSAPDEPLGALVVADAEDAAGRVPASAVGRAFRPRLLPRPLVAAGTALAGVAALLLWQPAAEALETPEQRAARLADQNRVAEVARAIRDAAKRVEEAAGERKEAELRTAAGEIRRRADEMRKEPPPRETALQQLNAMADVARDAARKRAGMKEPASTPEATAQDKALSDLLRNLSEAGLESLQKDLKALEDRLKDPGVGGEPKPSAEDVRALANRIDALRRAIERAASEEAGAGSLAKKLRSIANEDLLEKIAERLREMASKMEQSGHEGMQSESDEAPLDLGEMTREELEDLLKQLEEMAGLEDLKQMLQGGGVQVRGGRKLRLGGSGGT